MNNSNHFWTEARTSELINLWNTDITAIEIARMMGATKGMVIGKIATLGLLGVDPGRGARQLRKRWRDPAYRDSALARLHADATRARQHHLRKCKSIAARIAAGKRIIDPHNRLP
jgi:hypothetical protein